MGRAAVRTEGVRRQRYTNSMANLRLNNFKIATEKVMLGETPSTQYKWHTKMGEKVAEFKIWDWWDGKNVSDLEIAEKYRGLGLSYQLLDYATKTLAASNLAVEKDNVIAKYVYDKYGFSTTDEDDEYYYMSLDKRHDVDSAAAKGVIGMR